MPVENEDELLKAVALSNAKVILKARQQAERELLEAKEALERKTSQLADSLAMMRATLDAATDGILVTDEKFQITAFNQKFVQMWKPQVALMEAGDEPALTEVIANHFLDPHAIVSRVEEIYRTALPESLDLLELFDGRLIERRSTPQVVAGQVVGRVWNYHDLTHQRETENALREETRMLELLNNTERELASMLDLGSAVHAVTDAGTQIIGAKFGAFFYNVTDEKGEGLTLYSLSGLSRSPLEKIDNQTLTEVFGPMFKGEPAILTDDITKDPRYVHHGPHYGVTLMNASVRSYLSVPVVSRSGAVIGGLFFGHPQPGVFTERSKKIMEGMAAQAAITIDNARLYEAVTKLNTELEERVHQRTYQLEGANKELEAANKDLAAFSYSVSHDLRSPLASINGFSQMLLKSDGDHLSEKGRHFLSRICAGSTKMGDLIDGLLSLAKISRGKLDRIDVNLTEMSHKLVQELRDSEPDRLVEVEVQGDLMINGDSAMVTVIMQNLIANAWKYSGKTPNARIHIGSETTQDGVRCIFVRDNGAGFDMAYADKLFEVYQRLHQNSEFSGTGIGLANVKRVVTRHGGKVWAQAAVGEGATFRFTL